MHPVLSLDNKSDFSAILIMNRDKPFVYGAEDYSMPTGIFLIICHRIVKYAMKPIG